MNRIHVIIIHRDDAHPIEKCIKSLKETGDGIFLVDFMNSKKALELCQSHNIKYLKNGDSLSAFGSRNDAKTGADDYFLLINSNEFLSRRLINQIARLKDSLRSDVYHFIILKNYYGRWMKHSGIYPCKESRLFKQTKVVWTGNAFELKQEAKINVTFETFNGEICCMVYNSIYYHIKQINKLSETQARMLFDMGCRTNTFRIMFKPWVKFMKLFFAKFGILDGFYGLVHSVLSGYSEFLTEVKLEYLIRGDEVK